MDSNIFACSQYTSNLSNYKLSPDEISLLDKGLTYIPSIRAVPLSSLTECRDRTLRNIQLRDYFKRSNKIYDPTLFQNKFTTKSDWIPPFSAITKEARSAMADVGQDAALVMCKYLLSKPHPKLGPMLSVHTKPNLTVGETKALKDLSTNKNIVIKPADKGGAIVVMDTELYKIEGLRQLENKQYYKEIERPLAPLVIPQINVVLQEIADIGLLNDRQLEYLTAKIPLKPRSFYLLPKIHKNRSAWTNYKLPQGRPIVSNCGSETHRLCEYLDHFLQPLASFHPSYLKDTYDFIHKVRGQVIPDDSLLVTADVTALYTNMNIDTTIETVRRFFQQYPDSARPDEQILKLLEIALRNNDFMFANRIFLQILGIAMGAHMSPSLANMYLVKFDEQAKDGFYIKPLLYYRFLDDVHFVWTGSRLQLKFFENFLNSVIPGIKVTFNVKERTTEFLDVRLYKSTDCNGVCTLQTRVFFKETDTHQLLHTASYHPKHTSIGILKSQFIRFKRICSTKNDFEAACKVLQDLLPQRGYKRSLFRKLKYEVWHKKPSKNKKKNAPKKTNAIWPIVNYYDPIGVERNWLNKKTISKLSSTKKLRLISAFKNHQNLRKHLVHSAFN